MKIKNPIDQRHANPTGTCCPVFWRRFGTKFAWFLALYPWVAGAVIVLLALLTFVFDQGLGAVGMSSVEGTLRRSEVLKTLAACLFVFGVLLYPVGIVWSVRMARAVRNGLAPQKSFLICMLLSLPFQFASCFPLGQILFVVVLVIGLTKPQRVSP